jgi:hypothetical protein
VKAALGSKNNYRLNKKNRKKRNKNEHGEKE